MIRTIIIQIGNFGGGFRKMQEKLEKAYIKEISIIFFQK
jgi:hypothetical protein